MEILDLVTCSEVLSQRYKICLNSVDISLTESLLDTAILLVLLYTDTYLFFFLTWILCSSLRILLESLAYCKTWSY